MAKIRYKLRELRNKDIAFVGKSWVMSLYEDEKIKKTPINYFYAKNADIVNRIIENEKVIIICDQDDEDNIFGFCCYIDMPGERILNYIYIKRDFRKMGIARDIIYSLWPNKNIPVIISFYTNRFNYLECSCHGKSNSCNKCGNTGRLRRFKERTFIYNPQIIDDYLKNGNRKETNERGKENSSGCDKRL